MLVHRRAGIPTHKCLIPKCWTVKCRCLSEIFPARECPDSVHLLRLYRLKNFYSQLQNLTEEFPNSIQLLLLTKKSCEVTSWVGIPGTDCGPHLASDSSQRKLINWQFMTDWCRKPWICSPATISSTLSALPLSFLMGPLHSSSTCSYIHNTKHRKESHSSRHGEL